MPCAFRLAAASTSARTKNFREDECLDKALQLFRDCGYVGASISDLVRATGVNRYSLYGTFGDKRGLFIAAYNKFQTRRLEFVTELLSQPGPKLPLIRKYYNTLRVDQESNGPVSCFVTISAVSLANTDPEMANQVLFYSLELQKVFVQTLEVAREQGEIATDLDLNEVALALINAGRGMRIMAPFEGFNETITATIEATIQLLRPNVAFQNGRSV